MLIPSDVNSEGIVASSMPFMDTLIFFACVIYVVYSFVSASSLKDEISFKYGKN
jgi:hypothetical protein